MYKTWMDASLLAMEASGVVYLRMLTLAAGGGAAQAETQRMVAEKVRANTTAAMTLMTGGSMETVIAGYRAVVGANADRLLPRPQLLRR